MNMVILGIFVYNVIGMMTFDFERHSLNKKKKSNKNLLDEILQWIFAITIAIILAILIRGFVFEQVQVHGQSMESTLHHNDRLILNKLGLNNRVFEPGDIVVIEIYPSEFRILRFMNNSKFLKKLFPISTGEDYIKRIIAVEGDTVDIRDGYLYVNNIPRNESYVNEAGVTKEKSFDLPYTVQEGEVFVMGDNRLHSSDSRDLGPISTDKILGVTTFRLWPLGDFGKID